MEELLREKYRVQIADTQFGLSTDSMVLSSFARIKKGSRVLDLGCGCGVLGFLLLADNPSLHVTGVEIQEQAAAMAEQNILQNGLSSSFCIKNGDLRDYAAMKLTNAFDAVVSNPPYYAVDSGKQADLSSLSIARSEVCCTLGDLCRAASGCLTFGGSFSLVYKPERLADLFQSLRENRLEPKRIRFVRHSASSNVSLVLLEARLGGKPGLTYEPELILFSPEGEPTAECRRIYAM